ncbi:MAG: rod shape-determining protein [Lachnospiraceae bacterium]|nr:rod shape-determining protein [Lachnospiraceae bacterium]
MSRRMYGIDLGTSQVKILKKGVGVVLDQKNVIAIANKNSIIATGDDAYEMFEKAPANINVSYPVQFGVIAEIKYMQLLLNEFLKHTVSRTKGFGGGADFLIAVPSDITEVEKHSFHDLIAASEVKAKNILLVEKPIAAALGMGLDIFHANGVMVVDIGAATTEISILSLGGIVLSKLIPIGGNRLDESIKTFIKKRYNLVIGDKTAEYIKKELVSAFPKEKESLFACGRNVVTGLPCEMEIYSSEVNEVVKEHLVTIIESARMILERTPPEISADIYRAGVYVTGGTANLHGLADLFHNETDLKINLAEDAENTVALGLGVLMKEMESGNKLANNVIHTISKRRK